MGAETVKSNQLLHQLAERFPRTHKNTSVSTFDFQAAWNQAIFLALSFIISCCIRGCGLLMMLIRETSAPTSHIHMQFAL